MVSRAALSQEPGTLNLHHYAAEDLHIPVALLWGTHNKNQWNSLSD